MNKINNNDIRLEIEKHEYKLSKEPDFIFTSVTTIINKFFEPFDEVKISTHLANNVPKYFGETPESIMQQWQVAREYGTEVHLEIENWIKEGIEPKDLKSIAAKKWIDAYISKPNIDTFSEVIVYSKELAIAGTIDVLMMNKKSGEYVLIDWKTSKRIDKKSFNGKKGIRKESSKIDDSKYNHYALQLSLYRYILEKYYGIMVARQLVAQLKDDNVETYSMPYMKDEIVTMLNSLN